MVVNQSTVTVVDLRNGRVSYGFLFAHRKRISDILSWDRKSYLTHFTLPRLTREGCTLAVLELTRHSRQLTSSYVQVTSSHNVASQRN